MVLLLKARIINLEKILGIERRMFGNYLGSILDHKKLKCSFGLFLNIVYSLMLKEYEEVWALTLLAVLVVIIMRISFMCFGTAERKRKFGCR